MPIESHGLSDVGCVRSENQDRILVDPPLGVFAVADGMGGHRHGEMAAELAISSIRYYLDSSRDRFDVTWPFGYDFSLSVDANRLATGIQLANRQVWRHAEQAPEYAGMGTTIVSVLVLEDKATLGHVGDSRIYLFRAGALSQLTLDDTWISLARQKGTLTEAEALNHPMRNVLTQALGAQEAVQVHLAELGFLPQDLLLLTSDGVHGVVGDDAIRSILGAGESVEEIARRLIGAARASGAPDNASCVVLRYNP